MRHLVRRCAAFVTLAGLAALLAGCVYDPYTGGYYPCCTYPYHPYRPYAPYNGYPGYDYPPPNQAPPPR